MSEIKPVADEVWDEIDAHKKKLREAVKNPFHDSDFASLERKMLGFVDQMEQNIIRIQQDKISSLNEEINKLKLAAASDCLRAEKHEELRCAADEMYRFLCGLNLQDHPIADQRKFLVLMNGLKNKLKEVGDGSSGD